jgi:hypothetical protein
VEASSGTSGGLRDGAVLNANGRLFQINHSIDSTAGGVVLTRD